MRAGPRVPALFIVLLALAGLVVPVAPAAAQSEDTPPPDRTVVDVKIAANGDARWTVITYFEVDSKSDREAFQRLAERFESGEAEVTYDLAIFRRAVERANVETDRSMELVQPSRSSRIVNETGQLTLTFRWTNFARVDDDRLYVGDAFNTTESWLPGLASEQRLVVRPPGNYGVFEVPDEPTIEEGNVVYEGPATFEDGDLDIVFEQRATPSPTSSVSASQTNPPPGGDGFDLSGLLVFGLLAIGLGAVALGAYLRSDDEGTPVSGGDEPDDSAGGTVAADVETGKDDEVDLNLLSDEERVEYLLEQNGGRMKQANIVKETGWSNAKVSQLLSAMADEGRVDKLRIGRENLISLPDEEVASINDEEE